MKTAIELETSTFDFRAMVHHCQSQSFLIWEENDLEKQIKLSDFGTIFIGQNSLIDGAWIAQQAPEALIWIAPSAWRMAQIVKALGAFESIGQAKKNGWD